MNMLKYRNGSTTIQPKLIHSLPKSARISRVGVIQTYVSLRGSCLNFCTADRERGAFRLWFVLDKTRPLKQDLVNVSLSADCKGKLCWCVQIEINSPFPRPSDSFSIRWSIWAFQKMHAAFYWIFPGQPLIDPTFSLWIFYSLHQTMWDAPIFLPWRILVPTIATSFCRDVLTLPWYCRDLSPGITEIKALLGQKTGIKPTTLCQTSCQTFTPGKASITMRKCQFLQPLNSKYMLLFSTILAVFGPLDPLTWLRRLPRQLKTEHNHSAHHHVPADCET